MILTDKPAEAVASSYVVDDANSSVSLPTIVPFPTRDQLGNITSIQLPQVTLKLRSQDGRAVLVERALSRIGNKISQTCRTATISADTQSPNWAAVEDVSAALSIPRQTLENAALQVARLEKLNPSAGRNPLAAGIEQLSGFTRLKDVCERLVDKLSGYVSGGYADYLQNKADQERKKVTDALERIRDGLESGGVGPLPDGSSLAPDTFKQFLDEIESYLVPKRDAADRALSEVLELSHGEAPPANAQDDLVRARDEMSRLASEDPLDVLLSTWATAEKCAELRAKVGEINARLVRYEALQQDQTRRIRSTLYSRIEKWAEDEKQTAINWLSCPVCENDLTDRNDPMLDEPIRDAAEKARKDSRLLRETAVRLDLEWSGEIAAISAGCPGVSVLDLLAYAPWLLEIERFRTRTDLLGLVARKALPEPLEQSQEVAEASASDFSRTMASLSIAATLADRLDALAAASTKIRKERSQIIRQIQALLQSVDDALRSHEPVRNALKELALARNALTAWDPIYAKIAVAKFVGPKLLEFKRVREAIDSVVAHTLDTLKNRAIKEYYRTLYRAPWVGQPEVSDVESAQNGKLDILARIEDVTGEGARLLNQSHLRAMLLAFASALKQSADARSGGVDVFVLDDPQTLVDEINRDGLGSWLKAVRGANSRPVVLTHSDAFASVVEAKLTLQRTRVRPSSAMRNQGRLLLVGGANEIKELSDKLSQSSNEAICTKLCAAIRVELEDRLRTYCDALGLEMSGARPTLHDCRMALIDARSQPAFKDRLSTGPFDGLLRDRYIVRADDIAGRVMDALNEAHHAPKDNVSEPDAWQAKAAWEHLLPRLSACDRIAFDALNAPRVLPQRSSEPVLFAVPVVPVTSSVAAFQQTRPEDGGGWEPLGLGECHAVRVRRNFDWLPEYIKGGDVLLLSPTPLGDKPGRLLLARHFKPAPNNSIITTLGFSGKSDGRLTTWGVGGKAVVLEPPYEIETVRAILFAAPDVSGDASFLPLQPDDAWLSGLRAAPIIGESGEPFVKMGDHVLIREDDRIEAGQPLVDQHLYLLETADGVAAIKRFDGKATGPIDAILFQPIGASLGGSGTAMLVQWANRDPEALYPNLISGLWPLRGVLFAKQ